MLVSNMLRSSPLNCRQSKFDQSLGKDNEGSRGCGAVALPADVAALSLGNGRSAYSHGDTRLFAKSDLPVLQLKKANPHRIS
ncbi:hypothetical protein [Burkholderia sp. lig30]|uniref:hypothetical protein n=1 Tax=Burkholderia sp. lig30 TaxID=1192124 RepID=UPI001F37C671|nr:hypothetical protein [Burkholderia sp. lig30]